MAHGTDPPNARARRRIYSEREVDRLIKRFAALAVAVERSLDRRRTSMIETQLADLEVGLERMQMRPYALATLRGLWGLTNVEAARLLGVHPNTASRHYVSAVRWLTEYLNKPEPLAPVRELSWRAWARANAERVRESLEDRHAPGPGRPVKMSIAVDETVLRLHCGGSTEREIAETLNRRHPREDRQWTRASVRSVLKRYQVPRRPRGRRRPRGSYRPGDFTRPDYREVEFGEPFCEPEALLRLRRDQPGPLASMD
jgi:hypothetical protein